MLRAAVSVGRDRADRTVIPAEAWEERNGAAIAQGMNLGSHQMYTLHMSARGMRRRSISTPPVLFSL